MGIVVLTPLAVLMGTVLLLGWQLQVIETASMEPRVPAGSLAVVEPIDAGDVRAGMVVVFEDPAGRGRLVAHRAVKRLPGEAGPVWQTKGDANRTADPYPVHTPAIRGRVRWSIPRLGHVVSVVDRPATPFLLIGLPLVLLAVTEAIALRRRRTADVGQAAELPARVYAIHDLTTGHDHPHGGLLEVFLRHEDAERFIDRARFEQPALADALQIVERELQTSDARRAT